MLVLGVEVVGACGLNSWHKNSYTSPYVVLTFDGQQFQTTSKEDNLNPVWNEHFYFNVFDPTYLPKLFLEASVYFVNGMHYPSIRPGLTTGTVRIDGTSFVPLSDSAVKGYNIMHYQSIRPGAPPAGPTGEVLRMKVYVTDEASIRASDLVWGMDRVIGFLGLHVSSNHERKTYDPSSGPHAVPLQCLKDITNNFSEERIIGNGRFSTVYKGVLKNGEMIAVKKIETIIDEKQFEAEVCHLMTIKHPNIVRCVGYCYEILKHVVPVNGINTFAKTTEMLLCLEYIPSGSLNEYLSDESTGLNWSKRYKIIEGICYGLCHLHGQKDNPLVHLDLKPANILLSNGTIPKIADFGLSRLLGQQHTIYTLSRSGTLGYMPREFWEGGAITTKFDIFSLGVIIIEIITGGREYPDDVTNPLSSNEFVEIVRKFCFTFQNGYCVYLFTLTVYIIFSTLRLPFHTNSLYNFLVSQVLKKWKSRLKKSNGALDIDCEEEIKRCIQIGLMCLNPDRKQRPPIWNIINMLQGTESIVRGISNHATSSAGQACTGTDHLSGVDVAARPLISRSIRPHPRSRHR